MATRRALLSAAIAAPVLPATAAPASADSRAHGDCRRQRRSTAKRRPQISAPSHTARPRAGGVTFIVLSLVARARGNADEEWQTLPLQLQVRPRAPGVRL